jgi:hypothetical protein
VLRKFLIAIACLSAVTAAYADYSGPLNLPIVPITNYGVTTSSTATANSTAFANAITDCIAGTIGGIFFPSGTWNLASNPPALTGRCGEIYGQGPTTRLTFPVSDSASATTFFTLGADGTSAISPYIHDFNLVFNNAPTANTFALDVVNATDWKISNLVINHASSVFEQGDATQGPSRGTFVNISGDFKNGINDHSNFLFAAGSNTYMANIQFNGGNTGASVCNSDTSGAMVRLAPATGQFVDGVTMVNVELQCFNAGTNGVGKPYGLYADLTNGSIYDITTDAMSAFDHTSVAALELFSPVAASCPGGVQSGCGIAGVWTFNSLRLATETGAAIVMNAQSGQSVTGIRFVAPRPLERDGTIPVQISGVGYENDTILGAVVEDDNTHAATAAFQVNANGWNISDYSVGPASNSLSTQFQNVWDITNANLSEIVIGPGYWPLVPSFGIFPSWTVPNLATRDIWNRSSTYLTTARSVAAGGALAILTANTTAYFPLEGFTTSTTGTEGGINVPWAITGTFKSFYCSVGVAPGTGNTDICTLRVNGASPASGPTCQIANTNTSCTDTTDSASITAGQNTAVQIITSTSATGGRPFYSIGFSTP